MKKFKNEKGITLIALIVTIIILAVLAAVTINNVLNTGIAEFATNGAEKYKIAEVDERKNLDTANASVILTEFAIKNHDFSSKSDSEKIQILTECFEKYGYTVESEDGKMSVINDNIKTDINIDQLSIIGTEVFDSNIDNYTITLNLGTGISISNNKTKINKNESYFANIITAEGVSLEIFSVTMGDNKIEVSKTEKTISIPKVTDNVIIRAYGGTMQLNVSADKVSYGSTPGGSGKDSAGFYVHYNVDNTTTSSTKLESGNGYILWDLDTPTVISKITFRSSSCVSSSQLGASTGQISYIVYGTNDLSSDWTPLCDTQTATAYTTGNYDSAADDSCTLDNTVPYRYYKLCATGCNRATYLYEYGHYALSFFRTNLYVAQ